MTHRDLKPSNVFITRDGGVKLLDFGIAQHPTASDSHVTWALRTAGTPLYMAPEQWRGEQQDERTDIWAAGVVLFELLTGEPPYARVSDLRKRVLSAEPVPSVRARCPELPREAELIVARALAKNPANRYPTALELEEELQELEEQLAAGHHPPRNTTPQLRQVTLVSCWLVGHWEDLDAEDSSELEAAFHQCCSDLLQQHGGTVALCLGNKLLACFGYPRAWEDGSACAVRAGLHLVRDFQKSLRTRLPHPASAQLAVKVGIHTGQVSLDEAELEPRGQRLSIRGNALEIASVLATHAAADTVLLSDSTWELVRGTFEAESLGRRSFQGLPSGREMELFRPLRERKALSRFERISATGRLTPFVGREAELGRLLELWELAQRGHATWAFISGEAGIGKSRLLQEFASRIPGSVVLRLQGQCWPEASNSAFHPIIEMLTRVMPLTPEGFPRERARPMEERLRELDLSSEQVCLLEALFAPPATSQPLLSRLTPEQLKDKTLEALGDLLIRLARDMPVLAICEDLHWADPSSLQLLGFLLNHVRDARVLFLLSARTGFAPPWEQGLGLHRMPLEHLSAHHTALLIKESASGCPLAAETIQQLVAKTDGIPLFIEEMTRMVVAQASLDGSLSARFPSSVPATLTELLQARLDRLPRRQRALACICATAGRSFTLSMLSRLTGWSPRWLSTGLAALFEAGILISEEAHEPRYRFRHVMIQEVAYRALPRSQRQHFHRSMAQMLEELGGPLVEAHPELLARHYTEAGEVELAIRHWALAGERASQRSANMEAVHHLTRALQLLRSLPDASARAAEELRLLSALGFPLAQIQRYRSPEVEVLFERARELFHGVGDDSRSSGLSHWGLFHYHFARAKFHEAHEVGEQLVILGQRDRSRELLTLGHRMKATILFCRGQLGAAQEEVEHALAYADFSLAEHQEQAVKHWVSPRVLSLAYSAIIYSVLGESDLAVRYTHETLELAERIGHPHTTAYALTHVALASQLRQDSAHALEWADKCIALSREHKFRLWLGWSRVARSWALAGLGRLQQGVDLLRRDLESWLESGIRLSMPLNFGILAEMHLKLGQVQAGLDAVRKGLGWAELTGEHYYGAELYRLQGELLRLRGEEAQAKRCFFRARAIASQRGARLFELRAVVSLCRQPRDSKRRQAAWRMLKRICDTFSPRLDSTDLRAARKCLAHLRGVPRSYEPSSAI
ncbi:MAG TPA: AAA family ATPase [Myxococcaceae bacterium]|nr:AAA family ATPase [Myxococcaceae bacterium]